MSKTRKTTKKTTPRPIDDGIDTLRAYYGAVVRERAALADDLSRQYHITTLAAGMALKVYGPQRVHTAIEAYGRSGKWIAP
jgi:hypothetical protein